MQSLAKFRPRVIQPRIRPKYAPEVGVLPDCGCLFQDPSKLMTDAKGGNQEECQKAQEEYDKGCERRLDVPWQLCQSRHPRVQHHIEILLCSNGLGVARYQRSARIFGI
jgi:hypothetical protein